MTQINKVQVQVRQINSSYEWYKVQRCYNVDLYVHKDRHMTDRTDLVTLKVCSTNTRWKIRQTAYYFKQVDKSR